MSSFGAGLGSVIGSSMASSDLSAAKSDVNSVLGGFSNIAGTDINFGHSFEPTATTAINNLESTAGNVQSYNQFMQNYTNTPAAQYQLQQANAVQNSGAAANGNLLSGANERALGTIDNGIIAGNANTAYNEYLAGNQQQFGQLDTALGRMFNAIGVGSTATGQLGQVSTATQSADANIAGAQAKNDQAKGSGIGSMFSGLSIPGIPLKF